MPDTSAGTISGAVASAFAGGMRSVQPERLNSPSEAGILLAKNIVAVHPAGAGVAASQHGNDESIILEARGQTHTQTSDRDRTG